MTPRSCSTLVQRAADRTDILFQPAGAARSAPLSRRQIAGAGLLAHRQIRVQPHRRHRVAPRASSKCGTNGSVYIAKAFAQQPQFFAAVAKAASALPHPAIDVTPSLGTDWNGEPAIFISITAPNRSTPESKNPCGHNPISYADKLLGLAYDTAD